MTQQADTQVAGHEMPEMFLQLMGPFESEEVKILVKGNKELMYVDRAAIFNRLDNVVGPENWWCTFRPNEHSVECSLTIRYPDPLDGVIREITKTDAGGYAGMSDEGDDSKSGYTDSIKRAAEHFGIGRYLRSNFMPVAALKRYDYRAYLAHHRDNSERAGGGGGGNYNRGGGGGHSYGQRQPSQAPPRESSAPRQEPRNEPRGGDRAPSGSGGNGGGGHGKAPRSGRAMFAWTKEMEQKHEVGLLKYINGWAKLQDFPGRMVDWDETQVALAHAAVCRKLDAISGSDADRYEDALSN